jgi:Leucine-rich repeat (LRR) protein
MNKKTISIICLSAIYTILFYEQHVGINFLLFTLATLGFFFLQYKEAFKNKSVLILSFGAIFTSFFAGVHGSNLSLWATIISLMVIPGVIINKRSNVLVDFVTTLVNIAASTTFMIIEMVESGKKGKGKGFLHLLKYIVPIVFIIVFFFIYRAMNPLFEKFTQEIAEIISIGWVFFTLGGFILVYSVYKQKRAADIDLWESNWLINIDPVAIKIPKWNEAIAFILLFIVLNLMLVSVNLMDVNYLYLGEGMPDGITHKEFVHKGVGMLILSILLGISILLFFFRGTLNFTKNKNAIKLLAFLWVAQNVFMVFSSSIRNTMYVDSALLTYKRIGVYFWLFFALIGLITIFIKLYKNKTVWFLARHNFTTLFIVLLISSATDWDMVISNFNLNRANQMDEISSLDKNYMLSLSEGNISGLFKIKNVKGFEVDSLYSYSYDRDIHVSNSNWLDCKVFDFLEDDTEGDWRSYSFRRNRVREEIQQLHDNEMLSSLELQSHYIENLDPLFGLNKIKELNLNDNSFNTSEKLAGLNELNQLTKLHLNNNYIYNLDTLKENTNLTYFSLSTNEIAELKFLKQFPNLDTLKLNNNQIKSLASIPKLKNLQSLSLDGNPLNDISNLSKLKNLKELSLNQIANNIGKFPQLNKLEKLSLSGSKDVLNAGFSYINECQKLTYLDVSNNELRNLNVLINAEKNTSKASKLKTIQLNNNLLNNLYGIEYFAKMEYLNASGNSLYNLNGIEKLTHLKQLNLSYNKITDIQFLINLAVLQDLNLAENQNIKDFSPLRNLKDLKKLNLSNTGLKSLKSIKASSTLNYLSIAGCRIKNWENIKSFKNMETISLSYLRKEDIKYFKSLTKLKYVIITNTEESVVSALKKELKGVEIL